ncbi:MAG: HAD family hydrolase [Candidatus Pacearchaeota archaeon]
MEEKFKERIKNYKVIIFDLDGTLINSLPFHLLSFKEVLKEKKVRVNDKKLKNLIGISTELIFRQLKKEYKIKESIEELKKRRRVIYFNLINNKNILFPYTLKILKKLKKNYKISLATNSSRELLQKTLNKKFLKLFDIIITLEDVKYGKPSPNQLLFIKRILHLQREECLFIGDSKYDAIAAKKAGIDFIGLTTGFTSKKELLIFGAKKVFSSLKEIDNYLKPENNKK